MQRCHIQHRIITGGVESRHTGICSGADGQVVGVEQQRASGALRCGQVDAADKGETPLAGDLGKAAIAAESAAGGDDMAGKKGIAVGPNDHLATVAALSRAGADSGLGTEDGLLCVR